MKPIPLSLGDWVRFYSKGLWQIDRIIHEQYAIRYSLSEPKRLYDGPQVFVRRLVNDKWKVTCARESVHYSFVKKIGAADAKKLAAFIAQNPVAFKRFQEYQKPLDCVLNLGFSLPRKISFKQFSRVCKTYFGDALRKGATSDELIRGIERSEYAGLFGRNPRNATLQFISPDHEIKGKELMYRELNVMAF